MGSAAISLNLHNKVTHGFDPTISVTFAPPDRGLRAAGAQGTKALGIPGDIAPGVYHAKDVVYHYNGLPPFSQREFKIGERVVIIGIGNVMVDVAHWLVHVKKIKEVIAVARRGPAERAYTDVEIQAVSANIDTESLQQELERIRPRLEAVGQDLAAIYQGLTKHVNTKAKEGESPTRMLFRFLSAPFEIILGENGMPRALRVENTELVKKGESISAKGLGAYSDIEADTIIFAIGDRVDETLGLPCGGTEYIKNTHADPDHPGDEAYQVFDPQAGVVCRGMFVIGWSRKASDGLVGKAKQDGERGIVAVNHYLEKIEPGSAECSAEKLSELRETLQSRGVRFVDYIGVQKLENFEKNESQNRGIEFFKFTTDAEMLEAIDIHSLR